MEWVSLLWMGEWENFDEDSRNLHSLSFNKDEKEKDPYPHSMDLFRGNLFLSDKMET